MFGRRVPEGNPALSQTGLNEVPEPGSNLPRLLFNNNGLSHTGVENPFPPAVLKWIWTVTLLSENKDAAEPHCTPRAQMRTSGAGSPARAGVLAGPACRVPAEYGGQEPFPHQENLHSARSKIGLLMMSP